MNPMNTEKDEVSGRTAKHEQRVVGHIDGRQERMPTCVCGKPWPCDEVSGQKARSSTPPILCIDPEWPATPDIPNWVAICAKDWTRHANYFSLTGHIGAQWGQYVVLAVNSHASLTENLAAREAECRVKAAALEALLSQNARLREALEELLRLEAVRDDGDAELMVAREQARTTLLATGAL